ncbi:uncharacterized protein [Pseudorasbora parva]|uniref:uncharacterized protein n=1 Tax=Pseudorasbora parva TaxID=51549 RepID=UPI00351E1648
MCYICQDDGNPLALISLPAPSSASHSDDGNPLALISLPAPSSASHSGLLAQPSRSAKGFALQQDDGNPLALISLPAPSSASHSDDGNPLALISLPAPSSASHSGLLAQPSRSAKGFALQQENTVMSMLEAIGKPMACCSEEEMEEEKEKHEKLNEERHREDEGVKEKERKVYKVLGRLTAQGKSYEVDEEELRRRVKAENMSTNMFRMLIRVGKKDVPPNVLQQPRKAKTKVTIFSTLTEGEAEDLAKGFGMALAKHLPKEKLLAGIPEEDIPATLRSIERMKINVQNLGPDSDLDLVTHRFGPTAVDIFFSFLEDSMK